MQLHCIQLNSEVGTRNYVIFSHHAFKSQSGKKHGSFLKHKDLISRCLYVDGFKTNTSVDNINYYNAILFMVHAVSGYVEGRTEIPSSHPR